MAATSQDGRVDADRISLVKALVLKNAKKTGRRWWIFGAASGCW